MRSALRHDMKFAIANWLIASAIIAFNFRAYEFTNQLTANLYIPLAIIGQAFVLTLLVSIVLLILRIFPRRFRYLIQGIVAGLGQFLLIVDGQVFAIYRFHIDAFFIKMFFADFSGLGIGWGLVTAGIVALLACMAVLVFLAANIDKLPIKHPGHWLALILFATISGQLLHAWGYAHNMRAMIAANHNIPWYLPLTATNDMQKWGLINPQWVEESTNIELSSTSSMNYPLSPLVCSPAANPPNVIFATLESWRFDQLSAEISPNIMQIGQESLRFNNHLAGGSVTTTGLFSMFFGAPYLYWQGALAKQPVIMQAVDQLNYQSYIIANQDIVVNKLDEAFFKGHSAIQNQPEGSVPDGDSAVVDKLITALDDNPDTPFFSYLLFNSSHFPYWTPEGYDKPFLPAKMLSMSNADQKTDPQPHLNQYANSVHFLDSELGRLRAELEARNLWQNTILVITGDHGEEFNDQGQNFWGHGSNFSRYQLGVPLIVHWPGKQGTYTHRTSHEDIAATVATEALGCQNNFADLSTGYSLFDDSQRTVITSSYVNKAIIVDDVVNELYPGFVKTYQLDDINLDAQTPSGILNSVQRIQSHFR